MVGTVAEGVFPIGLQRIGLLGMDDTTMLGPKLSGSIFSSAPGKLIVGTWTITFDTPPKSSSGVWITGIVDVEERERDRDVDRDKDLESAGGGASSSTWFKPLPYTLDGREDVRVKA